MSRTSNTIYYKFKSANNYDTIDIDGPFLLCSKLKQQIILQKNLSKSDFDLKVEDVQSGREYKDGSKIHANSSVLLSRVPINRGKTIQAKKSTSAIPGLSSSDSSSIPGLGPKSNDGNEFGESVFSGVSSKTNSASSGDDKVSTLLNTVNTEYAPDKPVNRGGSGKIPPPGYICHRCRKPNHYIQDCPTNDDPRYSMKRVKRATGIPATFLHKVNEEDADKEGAMALPGGQFAVMKPNEAGFSKEVETKKIEVPDSLRCKLCKGLFKNPVMAPCCGVSFCDSCITSYLAENNHPKCPQCKKDLSVDRLVPNVSLNENVQQFKKNPNFKKEKSDTEKSPKHDQKESTRGDLADKRRREEKIRAKKREQNLLEEDRRRRQERDQSYRDRNYGRGRRSHRDHPRDDRRSYYDDRRRYRDSRGGRQEYNLQELERSDYRRKRSRR